MWQKPQNNLAISGHVIDSTAGGRRLSWLLCRWCRRLAQRAPCQSATPPLRDGVQYLYPIVNALVLSCSSSGRGSFDRREGVICNVSYTLDYNYFDIIHRDLITS